MASAPGRLLLVGDGPLRSELEAIAQQAGVSGRVHFLGRAPDSLLRACYHAADVFVLPSIARSEAFGLVQVEAMAAGKPVINTQLDSGVPFVSLDGVSGITVPPADVGALAAAITLLLENPELRTRFGAAARERACTEFSVETMTARILDIYSRLADPPLSP
jgi:rhamnosyl/mannosyltransferase